MGKIKKLPSNIANKIAAGEVVERPASVVKELVENSIDAGARKIEVYIERAGKQLIQIIDDGEGMNEEDALLAFERHATSKIKSEEDLSRILTLGFRGEALPSIASVSIVEVKTRTSENDVGIHLHLTGGKIDWSKPIQIPTGTQISIKNLFFNTPARRHFLRTDSTELQHILSTLKRFFISFPEIAFRVFVNNKLIFDFPSEDIDHRLRNVFGKSVYDGFIHFTEEKNGMLLDGYVARPDLARNTRGMEFFFLNNRPIENRSLHHAIIQAYGNSIERRQYPPYVLYLTVDPEEVDVNVHPTKMQVKFRNEHHVYQLFYHSVKKALNREQVIPVFSSSDGTSISPPMQQQKGPSPQQNSFKYGFARQEKLDFHSGDNPSNTPSWPDMETIISQMKPDDSQNHAEDAIVKGESDSQQSSFIPLFQLHNKYILAQNENGLMIVDQHVAHERILFEKALDSLQKQQKLPSQQLLFPQTMELTLEDYLIYSQIKDALTLLGFSTNELSGRTIVLESIPTSIKPGYELKVFLEIIDYFKQFENVQNTNNEMVAAAFACKNAVKAGNKLTPEEMEFLLAELFKTREPYFCPHGRPVIITLPVEELDKKFKRIK